MVVMGGVGVGMDGYYTVGGNAGRKELVVGGGRVGTQAYRGPCMGRATQTDEGVDPGHRLLKRWTLPTGPPKSQPYHSALRYLCLDVGNAWMPLSHMWGCMILQAGQCLPAGGCGGLVILGHQSLPSFPVCRVPQP